MPLSAIPVGVEIHNIEMNAGQGGKMVRSAGGVARLMAKEGDWATIILPSGEMRMIRKECRASIGQLEQLGLPERQDRQGRTHASHGTSRHVRGKVRTRSPIRWAAVKAGPTADVIRVRRRACLAKGGKTRNPRKSQRQADYSQT
jgi:large subunit ribosomal protein L2